MELLTIQGITVAGILLAVVVYLVRSQVVPKERLVEARADCAERIAEKSMLYAERIAEAKAREDRLQKELDEMTARCFELTAMARGFENVTDVAVSAVRKGRER